MSKFSIISKLLAKRGIESTDELTKEERDTLAHYQAILSAGDVTVERIKEFAQSQIKLIESKCDGVQGLTIMQQACLRVYLDIIRAIEAPQKERENLEKQLNQLITGA